MRELDERARLSAGTKNTVRSKFSNRLNFQINVRRAIAVSHRFHESRMGSADFRALRVDRGVRLQLRVAGPVHEAQELDRRPGDAAAQACRSLAAHRPLPSGRIGVGTAHLIAIFLMTMALIAEDRIEDVV